MQILNRFRVFSNGKGAAPVKPMPVGHAMSVVKPQLVASTSQDSWLKQRIEAAQALFAQAKELEGQNVARRVHNLLGAMSQLTQARKEQSIGEDAKAITKLETCIRDSYEQEKNLVQYLILKQLGTPTLGQINKVTELKAESGNSVDYIKRLYSFAMEQQNNNRAYGRATRWLPSMFKLRKTTLMDAIDRAVPLMGFDKAKLFNEAHGLTTSSSVSMAG